MVGRHWVGVVKMDGGVTQKWFLNPLLMLLYPPSRLLPTDAIYHYSNGTLQVTGPRETASIFATYPAPYLSLRNGFFDQVGWGVKRQGQGRRSESVSETEFEPGMSL